MATPRRDRQEAKPVPFPPAEFLTQQALYTKFKCQVPHSLKLWLDSRPRFHCKRCDATQAFALLASEIKSSLAEHWADTGYTGMDMSPRLARGQSLMRDFQCTGSACETVHTVVVQVDPDLYPTWIRKIGEWPSIKPLVAKPLRESLGEVRLSLFEKGLLCEQFGQGIGAHAYYRRIIELYIDDIISDVEALAEPDNAELHAAIKAARQSQAATEKCKLVKDHLPPSLTPDGLNPLALLHAELSEGIHEMSDEECLAVATGIRELTEELVVQLHEAVSGRKRLKAAAKKLQTQRSKRGQSK